MNFLHFIEHTTFLVLLILLSLVMISILSWAIIIHKYYKIYKENQEIQEFIYNFHNTELVLLYKNINLEQKLSSPEKILCNIINEYNKFSLSKHIGDDNLSYCMQRSIDSTIHNISNHYANYLDYLATIATVSPYIGLLGTVLGIIHSFLGISLQSGSLITNIAPGIAESLITTAMGLVASIPAYIFYNVFINKIDVIHNTLKSLSNDMLNIITFRIVKSSR